MPPRKKVTAATEGADKETGGAESGDVPGGTVDWRRRRLLTKEVPAVREAAKGKAVVYWMSRDQRVQNNWALLHAYDLAKASGGQLRVCFCLVPKFLEATIRQFDFMLQGLREVEIVLRSLNIPFDLLTCEYGAHGKIMLNYCKVHQVGTVVCDMSPLRVPRAWTDSVASELGKSGVSCVQVDAHNVVPVWQSSDKQETAARTIRKKITMQYGEFLTDFPTIAPLQKQKAGEAIDWGKAEESLVVDRKVEPVKGMSPGTMAALSKLSDFVQNRLGIFADRRNDPNVDACSGLSPYIHFGQISVQSCALAVRKAASENKALEKGCESFLEEAIVRRELSDNFCWYQDKYDSLEGAAGWARDSLALHEKDKREHIYSEEHLAQGKTHDDLWNAAQLQMVREGKMHGFLRMYWAKKILEWTEKPAEALRIAIKLNDKYSLDGRDPNGYVGVMWSICGIHDMGWTERPIFGKIRYMNYAGCKRKFNIPSFVHRYPATLKDKVELVSTGEERTSKRAKASCAEERPSKSAKASRADFLVADPSDI